MTCVYYEHDVCTFRSEVGLRVKGSLNWSRSQTPSSQRDHFQCHWVTLLSCFSHSKNNFTHPDILISGKMALLDEWSCVLIYKDSHDSVMYVRSCNTDQYGVTRPSFAILDTGSHPHWGWVGLGPRQLVTQGGGMVVLHAASSALEMQNSWASKPSLYSVDICVLLT